MKIKVKDLKKLIRENYAREIPQYAIDQTYSAAIKLKDHRKIFDYCKEELTHFFKMNINSTSVSQNDMIQKIKKMNDVFHLMQEDIMDSKNLKEDLKDILDRTVRRFLFI